MTWSGPHSQNSATPRADTCWSATRLAEQNLRVPGARVRLGKTPRLKSRFLSALQQQVEALGGGLRPDHR
jgi:hypothetical protein